MKKVILIIIIISLVGVLGFEIFKYTNNSSLSEEIDELVTNEKIEEKQSDKIQPSNEKTLDLHGTFKENDLIITKETIKVNGYNEEFAVDQISGLKDKTIENKINNDIKENCIKFIEEDPNEEKHCYTVIEANFSNVLSVGILDTETRFLGLNYNLTNGEKLKFEDLFKKNEDLFSIVRNMFYNGMLYEIRNMNMYEGEGFEKPYYDEEKGGWYANFVWYDNDAKKYHEEIREYILSTDEYEIEKFSKKFVNSENKNFYFSPSKLNININGKTGTVELKNIADKVVIYDKYLTDDSIFEKEDVGAKSVVTCTAETDFGKYKEAKYESNNYFYDICLREGYPGLEGKKELTQKQKNELIEQLKKKVDNYKDEAARNQDKAYFLFVELNYNQGYENNHVYDNNLGYWTNNAVYNNKLESKLTEKVIICNINDKEQCLEQILNRYRYYNLPINGSIMNLINNGTEFHGYELNFPIKKNEETMTYDLDTSEVNSIEKTEDELLPSSTRKIEKSEIQNWDKDKLYLAYNEIFARYGHDFKTQEYKDYFNTKSWYQPIEGKVVSLDELSEIEQYNANLIKTTADEK